MKRQTRTARTPRFHHDGALQANSQLTLSKGASHHLLTVLRMREGDAIELFNGDGCNYPATVLETGHRTSGRCAVLQLGNALPASTESPVHITLLQGISRGDRMDTSVRQSVELGVDHVQPLYTRHAAKALDEKRTAKKVEHWRSILISACEQSGRVCLPTLDTPSTFAQWAASPEQPAPHAAPPLPTLVLDPLADDSLVATLHRWREQWPATGVSAGVTPNEAPTQIPNASPTSEPASASTGTTADVPADKTVTRPPHLALFIGPESGLDADEIEQAVALGATRVRLGPRILRTENAGPACIAIVQSVLGDLV